MYDWAFQFGEIYRRAVLAYKSGANTPARLFPANDLSFLATIGCNGQELFDFVEDFVRGGDPDFENVLLITSVRRSFFLTEQGGKTSKTTIDSSLLPAKNAELEEFRWLPRIIAKAEAKLRGSMPPELMFCCGGDRAFLHEHNIAPADFLNLVRHSGGNNSEILAGFNKLRTKTETFQKTW